MPSRRADTSWICKPHVPYEAHLAGGLGLVQLLRGGADDHIPCRHHKGPALIGGRLQAAQTAQAAGALGRCREGDWQPAALPWVQPG